MQIDLLMRSFVYNKCRLAEPIHVTSETMNTDDSFTMSTKPLLESMTVQLGKYA